MTLEEQVPWLGEASKRRRWLAGVSGGGDSVALLHLLKLSGFREVVVCHLNHRLRGRESTADARFVAKLAERLDFPVEIGRVDVRVKMVAEGASVESAARRARHEFFAECARKHRCRRLLLAHHADDQAETVLWNVLRGSHGLKGMREVRVIPMAGTTVEIYRPLLGVRHCDLLDWLTERGLDWREDSSNAEPLAVRNRLRNEALPLLREISGRDPVASLVRGAADAIDHEELTEWALNQAQVCDPLGRLHLPVLRTLPGALQRAAMADFLAQAGVTGVDRPLLARALALLKPDSPPAVNLPGGGSLRRRGGRIFLKDFRPANKK